MTSSSSAVKIPSQKVGQCAPVHRKELGARHYAYFLSDAVGDDTRDSNHMTLHKQGKRVVTRFRKSASDHRSKAQLF
jgi:hypothetical protein